jgi:HEPN domain-containing protein
MRRDNSRSFEDWLQKAENDLRAAVAILEFYEDPPTDTVCYHCHQVAEKSLKGYLLFKTGEFPHVHDLVDLLNLCIIQNKSLLDFKEDVQILNKYYVESKYPPDIPISYPKKEAKEAIDKAKRLLDFLLEALNMG